jgi:hypothetical protein
LVRAAAGGPVCHRREGLAQRGITVERQQPLQHG